MIAQDDQQACFIGIWARTYLNQREMYSGYSEYYPIESAEQGKRGVVALKFIKLHWSCLKSQWKYKHGAHTRESL